MNRNTFAAAAPLLAALLGGPPALAQQAIGLAGYGGRVSLFAGFSRGEKAELDVNAIHYDEIRVVGAFGQVGARLVDQRGRETAFRLLGVQAHAAGGVEDGRGLDRLRVAAGLGRHPLQPGAVEDAEPAAAAARRRDQPRAPERA